MKSFGTIFFILAVFFARGQILRKEYPISKTTTPPTIDGVLDDQCWNNLGYAMDFFMLEPGNGEPEKPGLETYVKMTYDDQAIYFAIQMNDPSPDSILTELSKRDDYKKNCDWFGVFINPFNDGQNDFNFWVTASGVQADSRTTGDGDDFGWNTVWKSEVEINDQGWVLELEIPYQSLRFPKAQNSSWGLNMIRSIRRSREQYSWNFIDKNIENRELQSGLITGMQNINPPLRLSIIPNVTASYSALPENTDPERIYTTSQAFNAGADIKYGLTESFTLDMTLLPDFTQVAYDEQILNLGPFENRFDEQRQFFKEGIELFNKGGLFYSRRIGGAPKNITGVSLSELDHVSQNTTRMLNATKVSGRTGGNLGIGVLNAITEANYAVANDDGKEVSVLTEPFTNYNVISFDQRFNRNSSVSFVNTNVWREGHYRDANVSSVFLSLANKANSYRYDGVFKYSSIAEEKTTTGFETENSISRTKGNLRFLLGQNVISDTYNQNDLGFQTRNNRFNHYGNISYQTFRPTGIFNKYRIRLSGNYNRLYNPNVYENFWLTADVFFLFRTFDAVGATTTFSPVESYDYYEPRVWGKQFLRPANITQTLWYSSDYRRKLAVDARVVYWQWNNTYDYRGFKFRLAPRYRFNDHFTMSLEYKPEWQQNNIGWVNTVNDNPDSIVFGMRDLMQQELQLNASYAFNEDISLELRFRHFWTYVDYQSYHLLLEDGSLLPYEEYPTDHDINFNTLNFDLRFSWWYAPASQIVILYRNNLISSDGDVRPYYLDNLYYALRSNQDHTLSLRITYFLDINYLTKWKRKDVEGP